jgi:hypothetical protein
MYVLNTIEEVISFHLRRLRGDRTQSEMSELLGLPLRSYQALEYGSIPRPETRRINPFRLDIAHCHANIMLTKMAGRIPCLDQFN